jgi:exodeoxyribonuclease V alpha subunit
MEPSLQELLQMLERWVERRALRALDLALARFIHQEGDERDASVLLAVALTSERNGHGHVCFDLAGALRQPANLLDRLRDDIEDLAVRKELGALLGAINLSDWVARLGRSPAICNALAGACADAATPFVLQGSATQPLLYLRRYWQYERRILAAIKARLSQPRELDRADLRRRLDTLFAADASKPDSCNWQKIACALAARSAFAIITGGPGTGKTTTVVRLLAVLQGLAMAGGKPPLRIRLAAPTGKAAARLNASITDSVAGLTLVGNDGTEVRGAIPTTVMTLHRLLGAIPDSRHFRHHASHPLPVDLVVVDEASMVDVEMMARLLDALPPTAGLILLGDKDQLASVEAGAVLGDLCPRAQAAHYTQAIRQWLKQTTGQNIPDRYVDDSDQPFDQTVVMLRTSYRFDPEGGIGALAEWVNKDEPAESRLEAILELFEQPQTSADAALGRIAAISLQSTQDAAFETLIKNGYCGYLLRMRDAYPSDALNQAARDEWARQVLQEHGKFQLLSALRQGEWGVEGLNRRVIELLHRAELLTLRAAGGDGSEPQWFAGRPVLVTRNDYGLDLMNGDIGITLSVPVRRSNGQVRSVLRVAFLANDGSKAIRWILPNRLQAVETVFAMTVHKSQGSEFEHTALILPDTINPVLTRELLYTGITRAKVAFTLMYCKKAVLEQALAQRVQRMSGIRLAERPL